MTSGPENEPPAPYVGLRPFDFHEAPLFYGRGEHIAEMVRTLRQRHFLAVVGSSGSGKSSLVRAGLLPAIAGGFMNGDEDEADWRFVIMRPGRDPYENLLGKLLPKPAPGESLEPGLVDFRRRTLRGGPRGLVEVVADSLLPERTRLVVLVDQFEEIFRFLDRGGPSQPRDGQADAEQRNAALAFVDLLLATAAERDRRVYVVLTMRSEYLGECEAFLGLSAAIARSQFLTPRMTREQVQDVIERPVAAIGGRVEPAVVTAILNSLGTAQDQLPRVEHLLLRMWDRAGETGSGPVGADRRVTLTLDDYRAVGGFESALDQHANKLYGELWPGSVVGPSLEQARVAELLSRALADRTSRGTLVRRLTSAERLCWEEGSGGVVGPSSERARVAERLFRALADRTSQGTLVRRLTSVEEVAAIAGVPESVVIEVVNHFRKPGCYFLVATPAGELTGKTTLDISHESLLRQWAMLRAWVTAEADAAEELTKLVQAANRWNEYRQGLLRSPELELFQRWRSLSVPSRKWAERYVKPDEFDRADKYLRRSLRHKRILRRLAIATASLMLSLSILSVYSTFAARAAEKAAEDSEKKQKQVNVWQSTNWR